MNNDFLAEEVRSRLKKSRAEHTFGVRDTAVELAEKYGFDKNKAETAALLHDIAKYVDDETMLEFAHRNGITDPVLLDKPNLMHGMIGAEIAEKEFGITDREILSAIECHTFGKENMSMLDKIIYLSDIAEPGRTYFDGIKEIRDLMKNNINEAMLAALKSSIRFIISSDKPLMIDTVRAYNSILKTIN